MLEFDTLNINLGLERVTKVLNEIGNPYQKFRSIHVAGTNGKGSVCAMLASILKEAGFKVGLFTSPHLYKWNERINIDGQDISDDNLQLTTDNIQRIAKEKNLELTPFEIITCVAFEYFAKQNVDFAVVEVGMGGRLDATNVIVPIVSVITNVDFDHMEYLGKTLKEIASEKAGIIKQGIPVITAETKSEVLDVIKSTCLIRNAKIVNIDNALHLTHSALPGAYQRKNEAVVLKVAELLKIDQNAINSGLKNAKWPARFQIVSNDPLIIVDGAHNPAGATELIESIKELKIVKPITFILGFQGYKDFESMLDIYKSFSGTGKIILTRSKHPQSADLSHYALRITRYEPSIRLAIKEAKILGNPIIVAGSLFLAAEALEYLT